MVQGAYCSCTEDLSLVPTPRRPQLPVSPIPGGLMPSGLLRQLHSCDTHKFTYVHKCMYI